MPAWEDEANKKGGKWSIQLPREKHKANIDQMWLYTVSLSLLRLMTMLTGCKMLAAIGETFEIVGDSPHKEADGLVTGVIISPRPNLSVPSSPNLCSIV